MDEYLVGELQCPVCLELLSWPIILPCSHVLCRDPCAERLFVHGFIRCPVRYLTVAYAVVLITLSIPTADFSNILMGLLVTPNGA